MQLIAIWKPISFDISKTNLDTKQLDRDRQTMLVYFTWPMKGPRGHQAS